MCLEHLDHTLIHRLQQRHGVGRQKDELYITMQVLQHVGVGGNVVEDHQDTEGEVLRRAIQSLLSYVQAYVPENTV